MRAAIARNALFTFVDEIGDTVRLDLALVGEAQLLLNLDLDPQTLAIEPLLPPQLVPKHSLKPIAKVFIDPTPRMVDAHGVVGRDRPVQKRPLRAAARLCAQLLERLRRGPELLGLTLKLDIIRSSGDIAKHGLRSL